MQKQAFIICLFYLCLSSCVSKQDPVLIVAAAANTQFAMQEIVDLFEVESGIKTELITASSGKLTAQIKEGAPFDIFVSADMKYPQDLYQSDHSSAEPEVYAFGKLVLWSKKHQLDNAKTSLGILATGNIAIANPQTAPYGRAAKEVLVVYDMWEELETKLVYGESISQTNQFILSGAAEMGLTAMSVVKAPHMTEAGSWIEIPEKEYSPIEQGVVKINRPGQNRENADRFYTFLFGDKSTEILVKYGYEINR